MRGKALADEIKAGVRKRASAAGGPPPCLVTVLVGEDPASQIYVEYKARDAQGCGLESRDLRLPESTREAELLCLIADLNADPRVHGLLVQLPLPKHMDSARVALAIDPEKDVDGLHPLNAGRLLANQPGLFPCTPLGCIRILESAGVPIEGAHAVVIGRSDIVGKPVALMLLHRNATVTLCHSRTRDLPEIVRRAEIVIAALGKPRFVRGDWIKPGAAVIDVGVNRLGGQLVGDVDFAEAYGRAGVLTPVPGGVGLLTRAMLLQNTVQAFERQTAVRTR